MTTFLRVITPIVSVLMLAGLLSAGCGDEVHTSTTGSGSGGDGAAAGTIVTGGTGGVNPVGGGGGVNPVGGGGTGGTPIPNTGDDTCPGDAYVLNLGDTLFLGGDTSTATNDYTDVGCGLYDPPTEAGRDTTYHFTLNGTGTLNLKVVPYNGSTLNPTVTLKNDGSCDAQIALDGNTSGSCYFTSQEGFKAEAGVDADYDEGGIPYEAFHLHVDGADDSSGEYALLVEFTSPACGDGAVNDTLGEQCDDGNTDDQDGCASNCTFESTGVWDKCDGEPIFLFVDDPPQQIFGGTWGYADDYAHAPSAQCQYAALAVPDGGKERLYKITASGSGVITASVGYDADGVTDLCEANGIGDPSCWDSVLWVIGPGACDDGNDGILDSPQVACSDQNLFGPEQVSWAVQDGDVYFLFVDATVPYPEWYGSYYLNIELATP